MNKRETSLHPSRILTSKEEPTVRITRERQTNGGVRYSVLSDVALEREAIAAILAAPIGENTASWLDVRAGLKDIAYPSRRIRRQERLARKVINGFDLEEVRPVARELAHVLDRNQDYKETRVNIPVIETYKDAKDYIRCKLETLSPGRFANLVKSFEDNPLVFAELQKVLGPHSASLENFELQLMTGIDEDEERHISQRAILEASEPLVRHEMEQHLFEGKLYQLGRTAQYDGIELVGGSRQGGVFVRRDDIPAHLSHDGSLKQGVEMSVGAKLPQVDKPTGLDRYKVAFREQSPRFVALPELTWETKIDNDGVKKRRLIFESRQLEYSILHGTVRQRSTLAGAALLAAASLNDVDTPNYKNALCKITPRNQIPDRASVGLWPLVARVDEDRLLSHAYIETIEDQTVESPSWQDLL